MFETMDVYGQNSHENYVWTMDLWTIYVLWKVVNVFFAYESLYVNCDIVNCVFCCQLKGAQNSVWGVS
jgi:hypothetical protein